MTRASDADEKYVHVFEQGNVAELKGQSAASDGQSASICPYVNDDNPELMEIWLLGYAPHVGE